MTTRAGGRNMSAHDTKSHNEDILIVDDEAYNLKILTELLEAEGYRVRPAERPKLAIESALSKPPDLILLDVKMPEMDGFEVCRRLRQDEGTRDIPVIFISALSDIEDRVRAFQAGGVDFISKPFQELEVLARVRTQVQLHQAMSRLAQRVDEKTEALERALEELKASEEVFRVTFEHAPMGMVRVAPDGQLLRANSRLCEMLGYSRDELTALRFHDITHPDDLEADVSHVERLLSGESDGYSMEKRYLHKSGHVLWARLTVTLLRDERGEPKFFISVVEDITLRKEAEEARKESTLRLHLATTTAGVGYWSWDVQSDTYYASPEWRRQLGIGDGEIPNISDEWDSRLHPDDRERAWQRFDEWYEGSALEYAVEARLRHEDRSYRWIYSRCARELGEKGSTARVHGCHIDLTEVRQIQAERERVLTLSRDLICIAGMDGYFKYLNPVWREVTGYTEAELMARPFLDFIHPEDHVKNDAEVARLAVGNRTMNFGNRYICKDGSIRHLSWTAVPLPDEEVMYCIGRDVTERKQAEEELLEYQHRLKELAAELTRTEDQERRRMATELHDNVSQTLALMRIQLAVALGETVDGEVVGVLKDVSATLLGAIRDTRTIISELTSPTLNELGLAAAVSEWLRERVGEDHGLETQFVDDEEPKPLSEETKSFLFRSVRELLMNVVKHASAQRVTINLEREGDTIRILVEDDGKGLADGKIPKKKVGEGGYGLFSIEERMNSMGGSLTIQSSPGKGLRATLTAPLDLN